MSHSAVLRRYVLSVLLFLLVACQVSSVLAGPLTKSADLPAGCFSIRSSISQATWSDLNDAAVVVQNSDPIFTKRRNLAEGARDFQSSKLLAIDFSSPMKVRGVSFVISTKDATSAVVVDGMDLMASPNPTVSQRSWGFKLAQDDVPMHADFQVETESSEPSSELQLQFFFAGAGADTISYLDVWSCFDAPVFQPDYTLPSNCPALNPTSLTLEGTGPINDALKTTNTRAIPIAQSEISSFTLELDLGFNAVTLTNTSFFFAYSDPNGNAKINSIKVSVASNDERAHNFLETPADVFQDKVVEVDLTKPTKDGETPIGTSSRWYYTFEVVVPAGNVLGVYIVHPSRCVKGLYGEQRSSSNVVPITITPSTTDSVEVEGNADADEAAADMKQSEVDREAEELAAAQQAALEQMENEKKYEAEKDKAETLEAQQYLERIADFEKDTEYEGLEEYVHQNGMAEQLKLAAEQSMAEVSKRQAEMTIEKQNRDSEDAELLDADVPTQTSEEMWSSAQQSASVAHDKAKHARLTQMQAELAAVKLDAVESYSNVMQQHKHPLMHTGVDVLTAEETSKAILAGVAEGSHTQSHSDVFEMEDSVFADTVSKKAGDENVLMPQ